MESDENRLETALEIGKKFLGIDVGDYQKQDSGGGGGCDDGGGGGGVGDSIGIGVGNNGNGGVLDGNVVDVVDGNCLGGNGDIKKCDAKVDEKKLYDKLRSLDINSIDRNDELVLDVLNDDFITQCQSKITSE